MYDPEGARVVALEDVCLDIAPGEFCVVVGPSGCGKTTLLNIIAGFDSPTAGEIVMDGEALAAPGKRLAPGADRMVVFQHGALFPWKTVLWNITCGPVLHGRLSREDAEAEARALLARVGLAGIEGQYPGELSGGMKRRVEIIRALLNDPTVLLLDEPFRALDALTKSVWSAGHIEGAVLLPMRETIGRGGELHPERPVAVICHQGLRSSAVCSRLRWADRRRDLYNAAGGMKAWQRSGLPVVTENVADRAGPVCSSG